MGRRGRTPPGDPAETIVYRSMKTILTNENWHPTVDGKITVYMSGWGDGRWKVSLWGGDDFGMSKWFEDRDQAQQEFDRITNLIKQSDLQGLGFMID